jgi:hypothetical protein
MVKLVIRRTSRGETSANATGFLKQLNISEGSRGMSKAQARQTCSDYCDAHR